MKYFAFILLGVLVMLTAACSSKTDPPASVKETTEVEKGSSSKKEEETEQEKEDGMISEDSKKETNKSDENSENQDDEAYIHPELANNAKYIEVMNGIHEKPNQLAVTKEEQFAAVTKLFLLNPEVLDVKSRGLALSDAQLGDGTKLIYLAAVGEGMGAFYFYHPGMDEIATETNAEEVFGESPEVIYE
ncbi:MAG TPA: hypothetical protein DEO65_17585 [Bacillus bacterium]|uniref:Lipoprotein n=1 Tax=Siminovitchia fordii TaxID=254759 RepID=A0ABQ4K1F7_9BACI|nr:hypothetical protein [Siminovitchia fordii]GIN19481.1 hypothetical protein J1TS3_06150 [Siminovitchia fordii]HBZ11648.1 hypothetical protein [Bacillus sp. (in: firmicutes)]